MSIIYEALKKVQSEIRQKPYLQADRDDLKNLKNDTGKKGLRYPRIIAAVVIFFAVIFILTIAINSVRQPSTKPKPAAKTSYIIAEKSEGKQKDVPLTSEISVIEEEKVDKMQPLQTAVSLPELNLSGILYSEEGKWAIINNAILHEGDTIEGVKVLEIHRDEVVLEAEGKTILLKYLE